MDIKLSDSFTYRRLIRFVIPTMGMMMITSFYVIVDGFFVSNVAGKIPFAAINYIIPVNMIFGSFGFMIGTGGSALVGKTLGEGDNIKANEYFSMLIKALCVIGIIVSIAGIIFMRDMAELLGASSNIIEESVIYGRILLAANTIYMLQNAFLSFVVTAGKPHMGLVISLGAGAVNIILDFLLIYVLGLGVVGAAVATDAGAIVGGIIPLIYFRKPNDSMLQLVRCKIDYAALGKSCLNGMSEMLSNISVSIVSMLYNIQLIKIAAVDGVAAYGTIMYIAMIFMGAFFGFGIGSAPIISYHYGAKNTKELKNLLRQSVTITAVMAAVMFAVCFIFAGALSSIFVGYDEELLKITTAGMRLYAVSYLFFGFNTFTSNFFTALNNGIISAEISTMRTLVLPVAAVMILPYFWGIDGIWLASALAEGIAMIISMLMIYKHRKRYHYL